jgi:hypothetical protein
MGVISIRHIPLQSITYATRIELFDPSGLTSFSNSSIALPAISSKMDRSLDEIIAEDTVRHQQQTKQTMSLTLC